MMRWESFLGIDEEESLVFGHDHVGSVIMGVEPKTHPITFEGEAIIEIRPRRTRLNILVLLLGLAD